MKGTRQAHSAWLGNTVPANHAEPDPNMNPKVVPTAVELLTMPRLNGEAFSVVYAKEPVYTPPRENP
jgi:hypothetical protein